jgi:hypothetical protein
MPLTETRAERITHVTAELLSDLESTPDLASPNRKLTDYLFKL